MKVDPQTFQIVVLIANAIFGFISAVLMVLLGVLIGTLQNLRKDFTSMREDMLKNYVDTHQHEKLEKYTHDAIHELGSKNSGITALLLVMASKADISMEAVQAALSNGSRRP